MRIKTKRGSFGSLLRAIAPSFFGVRVAYHLRPSAGRLVRVIEPHEPSDGRPPGFNVTFQPSGERRIPIHDSLQPSVGRHVRFTASLPPSDGRLERNLDRNGRRTDAWREAAVRVAAD
jgi:hypothetical protein